MPSEGIRVEANPANPISSSAAARVELHLKVPTNKTSESLIAKPLAPLEVAAKESDKKIRTKTIRRTDCVEVGHDKFDEVVTNFLSKVGETNIISINPINAPTSSLAMKPGRSTGRIPENVLVRERAIATAGLANDVEAVNQYAAVM